MCILRITRNYVYRRDVPTLALHAPDGFLAPWVAAVTAGVSVLVVAIAVKLAGRQLGDKQIPLAGLAAAFIFATQMFNFPVASGTTGHLLGGTLAAILLGPWVGVLVVSVVVAIQALVFADGGLTALGYNVLNMAIVTAFGGWGVYQLLRRTLPRNRTGVVAASALAGFCGTVLASVMFSIEWLLGPSADISFAKVFGAMVGVHAVIGIGEGLITGIAVGAVVAARPDLVVGAADLDPDEVAVRTPVGTKPFVIGALLAIAVLAGVVSQFAFDDPDGLERVAADQGFLDQGRDHALGDSPFADYGTQGVDDERASLAVAGLFGAALTLAVGYGLLTASRVTAGGRTRPTPAPTAS